MGNRSARRGSTVLLPIGDSEQVHTALDALWPGFRLDAVCLNGIPKRARWFRWLDQTSSPGDSTRRSS
ncbi:hypothetical protein [Cutibacterium namnetense]|uniref:hypothetical protein n=1 Tax=Cutibacterium namnetense TaxID=1574624 RepID=UPI001F3AACE7|nr:hypothetical protein [Cutibacterium namnetense]